MELSDAAGKDGRRIPIPVAGSEFMLPVDAVVLAIGQKRLLGLIEALGLEHDKGVVLIDETTRRTSNPRIYAAGDIVFGNGQGEAMVVSAAEQGKRAAYAISRDYPAIGNTLAI
jgi:glutamate synthase (NADPH/NADH) small chain